MISDVLFYTGILLMCYVSLCVSKDDDKHRCKILVSWSLKNVSLTFNETGILIKADGTQQEVKDEIIKPGVINETVFEVRCCDGYFENEKHRCKEYPHNTYRNNCNGYRKCDHITEPSADSIPHAVVTTEPPADSTPRAVVTKGFQKTTTSTETNEPSTYKSSEITQVGNCKGGYCKAAGHGDIISVTSDKRHTVLIAAVLSLGLSTIVLVICIVARERYYHRQRNMIHDYTSVNNNNPSVRGENVYSEVVNGENGYIEMPGVVRNEMETEANFYSIIRDDYVAININYANSDVIIENNLIGVVEVNLSSVTDYEDMLGFTNNSVDGMS